jgi:hypothetical protein
VAVSRLETIYQANSKAIHQIYIYGNSLRAYLLAVVVPVIGGLGAFCLSALCSRSTLKKADMATACAEPGQQGAADPAKLKARLRSEIDNVARHKALQGYISSRD